MDATCLTRSLSRALSIMLAVVSPAFSLFRRLRRLIGGAGIQTAQVALYPVLVKKRVGQRRNPCVMIPGQCLHVSRAFEHFCLVNYSRQEPLLMARLTASFCCYVASCNTWYIANSAFCPNFQVIARRQQITTPTFALTQTSLSISTLHRLGQFRFQRKGAELKAKAVKSTAVQSSRTVQDHQGG